MIKAAIFDFDGTLMNTLPGIAHFCNLALSEIGLAPIKETEKFGYFVGSGRDVLIHRVLDYYGADSEENFEKVGARYDAEYEKDMLYASVVYPGIPELLKKLRNSGIKIAVLSNKPNDVASGIIEKIFPRCFDIYFGQRQGIPTKPAPDAALGIADFLGAKPGECVFIGDTIVDVTTGKNAGMHTIGVSWGFRKRDELEGADSIADAHSEIYNIIFSL